MILADTCGVSTDYLLERFGSKNFPLYQLCRVWLNSLIKFRSVLHLRWLRILSQWRTKHIDICSLQDVKRRLNTLTTLGRKWLLIWKPWKTMPITMSVYLQTTKNPLKSGRFRYLAEDKRFELSEAFTSPPFQDGAFSRSANPP